MKLTPLDIHHKEFRHSLRGYSEEEVDKFLDEVADDFERLFKENIELNERLEAASERLRSYQLMESTINHTLVTAQRSSEEVIAKAHLEADALRRDAESKAQEIVHDALRQRQDTINALARLRQAEADFRSDYRSLLDREIKGLDKAKPRDDVSLLLEQADAGEAARGVTGDTRSYAPVSPAATVVEHEEPIAVASRETAAEETPAVEPAETVSTPAVVKVPAQAKTARVSHTESVVLGEAEEPDLLFGQIELDDPDEFEIPGLASLGEREDDIDIEEID
ncbi:MAG: DivIVA domain-containing protein [Coriobacteriia bacterium]|nr:DivIVA domain-containing protein [Coriobacteriia bacterium]